MQISLMIMVYLLQLKVLNYISAWSYLVGISENVPMIVPALKECSLVVDLLWDGDGCVDANNCCTSTGMLWFL